MAKEKVTKKQTASDAVGVGKYLAQLSRESDARMEKILAESDKKIEKLIRYSKEQTERYIGALKEDFQHGLSAVAEQYLGIQKTLNEHGRKLDSHTEMIGELKVDMVMVKEELNEHSKILTEHSKDLKEIKVELKEKADKENVIRLDKRVLSLETQHI